MIEEGDIVELTKEYSYILVKHVRGFVKRISYNDGKPLYYIKIPSKYINPDMNRLIDNTIATYEDEIKKV